MQTPADRVLITGASSGIGAEFARLLAEMKYDLVIAARRRERLERIGEELQRRHGVEVTVVQSDLNEPHGAEQLFDQVQGLDPPVSMLINNAGFGTYGRVAEQDLQTIHSMIQVNVTSLTTLTRLFANDMGQRSRGYILNLASYAAVQPIPRYSVYSGAKAYVVAFSQAIRHELRRSGVKVSVLLPGFTNTEFHHVAKHRKTRLMRWTSLDARRVAHAGIVGVLKGKSIIIPGMWYKTSALACRVLPRRTASALAAKVVENGGEQ